MYIYVHREGEICSVGCEPTIYAALDLENRTTRNKSVCQASETPAHSNNAASLKQFFRTLRRFPRFGMQILAYGLLGGVSFAVPGCDDALLQTHHFSATQVARVNAAFLCFGIVSGIWLGAKCTARNYGIVLKTLFVLCTLALIAMTVCDKMGALSDAKPGHLLLVMLLFSVIGMSSLSFIGLGRLCLLAVLTS